MGFLQGCQPYTRFNRWPHISACADSTKWSQRVRKKEDSANNVERKNDEGHRRIIETKGMESGFDGNTF